MKKVKKKKTKGLKNPAAIIAVAPEAGKATTKINKDTGNAVSWAAVAVLGLGVFLIYKVVKNVSKATDTAGDVFDGISDGIIADPAPGNTTGAGTDVPPGATINVLQARTIAVQLLQIMDSFWKLNQSEQDQVIALLNGKTPRDYIMISDAFGRVWRHPMSGDVATNGFFSPKLNLTQWLTIEMGVEGMNRLRQAIPGAF